MKKVFLVIAIMSLALCMLAITSFAQDVTTLDEIKTAITNATAGDELVFDMKADILIPNQSSAIVIDKDITVTINTNGYVLFSNTNGGSAGNAYGIKLVSVGAKLIMNGATTDLDYKNYVEPTDEQITVSNGVINNPNIANGVKSPDMASTGPAIVCFNGSVELNNMYIRGYNSGEWTIFFYPHSTAGDTIVNNLKATNSLILAPSSRYAALGTRNGGGNLVEAFVQMEGCVFSGTGTSEWLAMSANSYIKNSRVTKHHLKIDGYLNDGYAKDENSAILQNVIFESSLSSNTGTTDVNMIDCVFLNGMSVYVTGDSKGATKFTITQSATCTEAGKQAYVNLSKGSGKTFTSFDEFTNVVEEYTTNNPPKGHTSSSTPTALEYTNGFDSKGFYSFACAVCTEIFTETDASAKPMIEATGYSVKEDTTRGYGLAGGYTINHTLRAQYESLSGKTLEFGVIMFNVNSTQASALTEALFKQGKLTITEKSLQIDATNTTYSMVNFLISGFDESSFGLELAIAFYMTEIEGEGESITYQTSFVQSSTKTEGTYENDSVALTTVTYYSASGTPNPEQSE